MRFLRLLGYLWPLAVAMVTTTATTAADAQTPPPAPDPVKRACASSYERGQLFRRQGKLLSALDQFLICSQDRCPQIARRDCARWLSEVERELPTIVMSFVDPSGRERSDVSVTLDGQAIAARLDGSAVTVDPGRHRLVLTPRGGAPETRDITVRVGEKNRPISVDLARPGTGDGRRAWVTAESGSGPHPMAYAVAGVGVIGWGLFAGFGGRSLVVENEYRENCAPACSADQIDDLEQLRLAADISLTVAAVATAAAATIAILTWRSSSDEPDARAATLNLSATPRGLVLDGVF